VQAWGRACSTLLVALLLAALSLARRLVPAYGAWLTYPAMASLLASLALVGVNFLVNKKVLPWTRPLQAPGPYTAVAVYRQVVSHPPCFPGAQG
jgi:hypothetical protein